MGEEERLSTMVRTAPSCDAGAAGALWAGGPILASPGPPLCRMGALGGPALHPPATAPLPSHLLCPRPHPQHLGILSREPHTAMLARKRTRGLLCELYVQRPTVRCSGDWPRS